MESLVCVTSTKEKLEYIAHSPIPADMTYLQIHK